jgi:hypothetical protein
MTDTVWILIRLQKQHGTSITRIAKIQSHPALASWHQAEFYDHPLGLTRCRFSIYGASDVGLEFCRQVAELFTKQMSTDRNDWTVSTEIIDEDEAVECRIALEVV